MCVCVAASLITAAVPGPTVFLEQWGCIVDGMDTDAILVDDEHEEEGEEEASLDNTVSAEDLTKFREGDEMSLNLLWAKIRLPASLIMNMDAQKSEEEARQSLGQLRGFFVRGPFLAGQ